MQETQIQFPGRENPLEEEMATHSSILAWIVPWTEEPDGQACGLQSCSLGVTELDMTERLTLSLFPYILLDKILLPIFHYYREYGL